MNFKINREVFLENLNIISRALPSKTTMPILTGIKLEVTDTDLFMTSSNMDISIEIIISDVSLEIKEKGKTVIPGKFFIDIIRKVNSKTIDLTLIENKILLIKVDRGEYKLNVMDAIDYPDISFVVLENPLVINSKLIKNIIKETGFTASLSEKKPILTGVNFKLENNLLCCTSTDSFRLSKKLITLEQDYNDFNINVPNKSLDELSKVLDNYNDDLSLYFSNNKILFKYKNVIFQSRLLDGNFPDTSRLIPSSFPIKLVFNRDELIEAVERVSLLSPRDKERDREITYSIIKLKVTKNEVIEISSTNNQVGEAKEELVALDIISDLGLKIAFSSKYLIEALRSFDTSLVALELSSEIKPFIITNNNDKNLIQLILPVRMD